MKCPICERRMELDDAQNSCENYITMVYNCEECALQVYWTMDERLIHEVYSNRQ